MLLLARPSYRRCSLWCLIKNSLSNVIVIYFFGVHRNALIRDIARRFLLVIISIYFYFHANINIHFHMKMFLCCVCLSIIYVWILKYVQFHESIRLLSNTNISICLFMYKYTGINTHTHTHIYIYKWHTPPHKACQGASISHPKRHVWHIWGGNDP